MSPSSSGPPPRCASWPPRIRDNDNINLEKPLTKLSTLTVQRYGDFSMYYLLGHLADATATISPSVKDRRRHIEHSQDIYEMDDETDRTTKVCGYLGR